jgi:dTDP-4-dehydrorhamnose reductase
MIAVLGASGYVGTEFVHRLSQREIPFNTISRSAVDIYKPRRLANHLIAMGASFLINCAGYTGKPNVDACELQKADCLEGNAILPGRIQTACELAGIPWGHVSSGCIFTGCRSDGNGFTEQDLPNFSFRTNNCSYYSGTKALGEEILADCQSCYVWRLRIPFNEFPSPRNYLSKLLNYKRLLEATNSLSHLGDFVDACLACWSKRVPFGVYNVTNTGSVTSREVTEMLSRHVAPGRSFDFFETEEEFMAVAAKTPRSNCVLDNAKLRATGVPMPDVYNALERAMANWPSAKST